MPEGDLLMSASEPRCGDRVQIDGSPHDRVEGPWVALHADRVRRRRDEPSEHAAFRAGGKQQVLARPAAASPALTGWIKVVDTFRMWMSIKYPLLEGEPSAWRFVDRLDNEAAEDFWMSQYQRKPSPEPPLPIRAADAKAISMSLCLARAFAQCVMMTPLSSSDTLWSRLTALPHPARRARSA